MPRNTGYTTGAAASATLEPLVQLFPDAIAVRIPVQVSIQGSVGRGGAVVNFARKATIEFGTARVVFFQTDMPLEIDDYIHLENEDGSLATDAVVIAVQYQDQNRGVAARFPGEVRNWIIQV
jgi:hypothetical protein